MRATREHAAQWLRRRSVAVIYTRILVRWLVVLGIALAARVALAESAGGELLARGVKAFDAHDYKNAAKLLDSAIARGALSRDQTLTAYIDLGTAQAALGKTRAAAHAFEQAALIDPGFALPPRSSRRASALARQARHKQEPLGPYHLDVDVPGEIQVGTAFHADVRLSAKHQPLIAHVRVTAHADGGKDFEAVEPSAEQISVEIPGDAAVAAGPMALRFELLDAHDNRLASLDQQVAVAAVRPAKPVEPPPRQPEKPPHRDEPAAGDDTHGEPARRYTATRVEQPPRIDGTLDDKIWQTAPRDDRFLSTTSEPYGKPTEQPTVVQLAYDDKNLYVAFRCNYAEPRPPSDTFAGDEETLLDASEYVSVIVDALHGRTGGYKFTVSPAGARADAEISDQGTAQNLDWHGLWDAGTARSRDGWTAEIAIPWGTLHTATHDEPFDVDIQLERYVPDAGEVSVWTFQPPATELYDVNFFGHVDGLDHVHPGLRLLVLPYAAAAFDSSSPVQQPRLSDLTGRNAQGRVYAGAYLRLQPAASFRVDATFNPDFSAVNADRATANFDRFELEYPEARPFFTEDAPRFQFGAARYKFGDLGAQLFYSRRLGIVTDASGFTQIVPILWGVKSVLQSGGTEAAVMNVETIKAQSGLALNDNETVGRVGETIAGQRIGAIVLACQTCGIDAKGAATQSHVTGGADLQLALFDRHLSLRGFWAGTRTGATDSAAGEGTASWRSREFYAKATLLDVGKDFQAPLGFFETTGVRAETAAAGYTPVLRAHHVQQVFIEAQLSQVSDRDRGDLVYRRPVFSGSLQSIEGAFLSVSVSPATEVVGEAFPIGNGAIMVPPGTYRMTTTQVDLTTPANGRFVFGVHYLGGTLFDGTRNAPGATLGLNLGRLTASATYYLYRLQFPDQMLRFYAHDVSFAASYAYSPLARTTAVVTYDTLSARSSALATTSLQFGKLSAITLSVRGAGGSTFNTPAMHPFDNGTLTAILSLQLGASPF